MFFTVDRIEYGCVVLIDDDCRTYVIPGYELDIDVREGDVLRGELSDCDIPFGLVPDENETKTRRERIHSKFERLKNKGDNKQ